MECKVESSPFRAHPDPKLATLIGCEPDGIILASRDGKGRRISMNPCMLYWCSVPRLLEIKCPYYDRRWEFIPPVVPSSPIATSRSSIVHLMQPAYGTTTVWAGSLRLSILWLRRLLFPWAKSSYSRTQTFPRCLCPYQSFVVIFISAHQYASLSPSQYVF